MAWSWFRMLPSAFHWLPFPSLKIQHAYVIEISSGKTRSTVPSEHVHIWANEGYRVSSPKKWWNYYRLWWYLSQYHTEKSTENSFDSNNSSKKSANKNPFYSIFMALFYFCYLFFSRPWRRDIGPITLENKLSVGSSFCNTCNHMLLPLN